MKHLECFMAICVLIFILGYANATDLSCYYCDITTDCDKPQIEHCAQSGSSLPAIDYPVCFNKQVSYYGDSIDNTEKSMGCFLQNETIDDLCEFFKNRLMNENCILDSCFTCNDSLCNANESKDRDKEKSLECYSCVAKIGTNNICEESPKNASIIQTCPAGFVCGMHVVKKGDVRNLHRECYKKTECQELSAFYEEAFEDSQGKLETCTVCESNLCNGEPKTRTVCENGKVAVLPYKAAIFGVIIRLVYTLIHPAEI